jgi:DNA-directed RNA polymerase subunit beta'
MRTFHIGGTASRVSEQSRLDAKNNGTVRFIGLQTVKAKSGDLVVMNRQGSIAVVDEKNRERERYSVVYGAKLKVNEGDPVTLGQVMVEWDPYTFAILTEIGGTVQFKDLQEGVTLHEEVDEVTGLSRHVVGDSPDEKRSPRSWSKARRAAYLMLSRAHLMRMAIPFHRATAGKDPARNHKNERHHRWSAAWSNCSKPASRMKLRLNRCTVTRRGSVDSAKSLVADNSTEKEYPAPRGVHINVQEASASRRANPRTARQPARHPGRLGEKSCRLTWERNPGSYRLQASTSRTAHRGIVAR